MRFLREKEAVLHGAGQASAECGHDLTAAFGPGINQSSTSRDGDDAQDRGNRDGVVFRSADLNWSHIHGLFLAGIGESSVDERRYSGKYQQYSDDLHARTCSGPRNRPAVSSYPISRLAARDESWALRRLVSSAD